MADIARVAVVGLGNMGLIFARRLIEAGHAVTGADPEPAARDRLAQHGGLPFATAVDAVDDVDVVILMLPDSDVVDSVIADLLADGRLKAPAVIVDMSSSDPSRTRANMDRLREAEIAFLDAPVSGGVRGAEAGSLSIMVGGDRSVVDSVRPILGRFGTVRHVGPIGAGHALKALNNLVSATHLWITSEAVYIAQCFAIDSHTTIDVLNHSSGRSGSSQSKWPDFILSSTYDSGFAGALMLKDARIATRMAREVGLRSPLGEETVVQWAQAVHALGPSADHTEVARWLSERPHGDSRRTT